MDIYSVWLERPCSPQYILNMLPGPPTLKGHSRRGKTILWVTHTAISCVVGSEMPSLRAEGNVFSVGMLLHPQPSPWQSRCPARWQPLGPGPHDGRQPGQLPCTCNGCKCHHLSQTGQLDRTPREKQVLTM